MTPQNSGEWGIGICYFPKNSRIPFYFSENSDPSGYIYRTKNGKIEMDFNIDSNKFELNYNDFNWVGHSDCYLLKVYKTKALKYYVVFSQSLKNGILIRIDDTDKLGINFFDYTSLIFHENIDLPEEINMFLGFANIGLNLHKSCINLRLGPSINNEIITCLKSNDWRNMKHTHMKIIERNGDWAKIEAITYIWADYNCDYEEFKKFNGWIKVIDEHGKPNIWYSITSY